MRTCFACNSQDIWTKATRVSTLLVKFVSVAALSTVYLSRHRTVQLNVQYNSLPTDVSVLYIL